MDNKILENTEDAFDEEPEDQDSIDFEDTLEEEINDEDSFNQENDLDHANDSFRDLTNSELINQQINNIVLPLSCEVSSISLSLNELNNLQAGQILDVADLPPKVRLMANNQLIATGVLVSLNGRLGLRID